MLKPKRSVLKTTLKVLFAPVAFASQIAGEVIGAAQYLVASPRFLFGAIADSKIPKWFKYPLVAILALPATASLLASTITTPLGGIAKELVGSPTNLYCTALDIKPGGFFMNGGVFDVNRQPSKHSF